MECSSSHNSRATHSTRGDTEGGDDAFADSSHQLAHSYSVLSDAESVIRPDPTRRRADTDRDNAVVPARELDVAAVASAVLTDDQMRTLLSQMLFKHCLTPSNRVGEHPATLVVGAVVQAAFHRIEPPQEWITAVGTMSPSISRHSCMLEIRRWLRRAVGEWRRSPAGPDAASLESGIANLLDVRDRCRDELSKRYPAWMGGVMAGSWGATPAEWEERQQRQGWLVGRLLVSPAQKAALQAALAEYRGGSGDGEVTSAPSCPADDVGPAGVLAGHPDAVERYNRLGVALMGALTWRQRAAACIVMFPFGSEFSSLCAALVDKGSAQIGMVGAG